MAATLRDAASAVIYSRSTLLMKSCIHFILVALNVPKRGICIPSKPVNITALFSYIFENRFLITFFRLSVTTKLGKLGLSCVHCIKVLFCLTYESHENIENIHFSLSLLTPYRSKRVPKMSSTFIFWPTGIVFVEPSPKSTVIKKSYTYWVVVSLTSISPMSTSTQERKALSK